MYLKYFNYLYSVNRVYLGLFSEVSQQSLKLYIVLSIYYEHLYSCYT